MAFVAVADAWTQWSLSPLVLVGAAVAVALFFQGFHRLRARGRRDLAPWGRAALFVAGVAITVLALISPLDTVGGEYLLSAHMLQHVLIADLGVAVTLVAVRGPLAVFFLPRDLLVPLARAPWLRGAFAFLLRPGVSLAVWALLVVTWHLPPLYELALRSSVAHTLEHLGFVAGGLLVWTQIVDPTGHRRLTLGARIGYVALVYWTGQVLAYAMAFAPSPLYGEYADQPERLLGLSALTDQRLAAVVMMVEQTLTLGAAFVLLFRAHRRSERRHTGTTRTHQRQPV
jgi:cytochrome c oxidase assembly factor CtaG